MEIKLFTTKNNISGVGFSFIGNVELKKQSVIKGTTTGPKQEISFFINDNEYVNPVSDESRYFEIVFDKDKPLRSICTSPNLDDYGEELSMEIKTLDLSHFDTSQINDMHNMFNRCGLITELDISHFDTSKVTNMSGMFDNCYGLTSLDLSNFDTSKVKSMQAMFYRCMHLTSLDLSNWNLSNITDEYSRMKMFEMCDLLKTIKINDEASANKLIVQIKDDLNKTATWNTETKIITIPA